VIRNFLVSFLLFTCCLLAGPELFAQRGTIDSLEQVSLNGTDREKLTALQLLVTYTRNNDPQRALNYLAQAIDKATALNDVAALAKCYQLTGSIQYRTGNFAKAKENFLQSLNYYIDTKNNKGQAEITAALAGIYYEQGDLPQAADHYLRALRYYEEVNDKSGMVSMLSSLGRIYARQNNFSKSIEYNLRAINLYEETSDKLRALVGYDNIGNIYLRQNNPRKAQEYFNKSLKLYTEMKNDIGIASTLLQLGNIEYSLGNHEKAMGYFRRSLGICTRLNAQPLIVSNLNALGKTYMQLSLYDKAEDAYRRAITIAKDVQLKIELDEAYQGLAQVYKLMKENEKSRIFEGLSKNIRNSVYNDSTLKKLTDQILLYESEKKEQQIQLLNKEQLIKQSELNREREIRNFFYIAGVILGLALIVLIIFAIRNRRIARSLQKQQTELIEKNRSIMEQKEKLDQLNTVKDRFFSIISHDLRNNLTTMKLYFDLVGNENYEPADNSDITKQISGSVENTIDLLENLLVWASAQIKGIPIHIQKLNLHTLAEENISLVGSLAHQKNITLKNNISEDAIAFGDIDMINLVLRNLVSNAIKFTGENGLIELSSAIADSECIVSVKDNGVGISEENLARLFNQHQHPTTKGTANEKGTGLGLMLCKEFVERNGGRIWVESRKDMGTTFFFTLPLQA
jgi:signal transduction histidine kinase/Tfp pilus assembly protein PilF